MAAKGTVKPDVAFRAFQAGREDRAAAAKPFHVRSLNKDGTVSRMQFTAQDYQHRAFATRDEADRKMQEMLKLNPGARFVVHDQRQGILHGQLSPELVAKMGGNPAHPPAIQHHSGRDGKEAHDPRNPYPAGTRRDLAQMYGPGGRFDPQKKIQEQRSSFQAQSHGFFKQPDHAGRLAVADAVTAGHRSVGTARFGSGKSGVDRPVMTGARGGRYMIGPSGQKIYMGKGS